MDPTDCAIVSEECCEPDPSLVVVVVDGLAVGLNTTADDAITKVIKELNTMQSLK